MAARRFRFTSHSAIAKKATPPPADGSAKDVLYFDDRGDPPGFGTRVGRALADGATLRNAFERHVRSLETRRKQPRSIVDAEGDVERYWSRYIDRELHTFSRVELDDIHRALTDERGPEAANRACRLLRAAWRNMVRLHESLPDSPTFGITWNPPAEERRPIAWSVGPEF